MQVMYGFELNLCKLCKTCLSMRAKGFVQFGRFVAHTILYYKPTETFDSLCDV
jgi:hypothetical protein